MTARTARREREGVRGREGPVHGDIMLLGIMRFMLKYSGGEEAAQWERARGTQIYVGCCNIDAGLPARQPTIHARRHVHPGPISGCRTFRNSPAPD